MKSIPISAAKAVAEKYGYDQLVIVGRKIGEDGGEHVTTYGVDKANCDVAARIGHFFKHKLMGWPAPATGAAGDRAATRLAELEEFVLAHPGTWQHWKIGRDNKTALSATNDEGTK